LRKRGIVESSLVRVRRTYTTELEDLLCHALEHQPEFELTSKPVGLGHCFHGQKSRGAALWNTCTLRGEHQEQELRGRQLARLHAEFKDKFQLEGTCEICSSLQMVFADCVTFAFLRRKQGTLPYLHEFHIPLLG